jgi:hypothetical protein
MSFDRNALSTRTIMAFIRAVEKETLAWNQLQCHSSMLDSRPSVPYIWSIWNTTSKSLTWKILVSTSCISLGKPEPSLWPCQSELIIHSSRSNPCKPGISSSALVELITCIILAVGRKFWSIDAVNCIIRFLLFLR